MKNFTNIFVIFCAILCVTIQCVRHPIFTIKNIVKSSFQQRIDAIDAQILQEHTELDYYRRSTPDSDLSKPAGVTQQQSYQARLDSLQQDREKLITQGCFQ